MVNVADINLPPHNIDAEKSILCAVLLDNDSMYIADSYKLGSIDFYQKEHQIVRDSMAQLWSKKTMIDIITLSDNIGKNGGLELIGGQDYLFELSIFSLATNMTDEYTKIVKEKSVLRQIIKASQGIISDCYSQGDTIQIIESIERKIFELTQFDFADGMLHIRDILTGRMEDYVNLADNPNSANIGKILSDFSELDELTSGFKPGELIILAARPSMGKTAFGLNILANAAIRQKKSCIFFSLEMTSESIVDRLTALISGVRMDKISRGDLSQDDFEKIGEANSILSETNIYIDDRGATIPEIRSKTRKLSIEKGVDFIIIDYLQLISAAGNRYAGNKVQEIGEISRSIKELAKDLKIPIIALSQLSREVEKRPDKKPMLSDLRDSGSIEQDADLVLFLYRDEYYDPDTDRKGVTDVLLRKNRNGTVGDVGLARNGPLMKFANLK